MTDPAPLTRLAGDIAAHGQLLAGVIRRLEVQEARKFPPPLPAPAPTEGCACWLGLYEGAQNVNDNDPYTLALDFADFIVICGTAPTSANVYVNGEAVFSLSGAGNREFSLAGGSAPPRGITVPGVSTANTGAQHLPVSIITNIGADLDFTLWQDSGGTLFVFYSFVAWQMCGCACNFPSGG